MPNDPTPAALRAAQKIRDEYTVFYDDDDHDLDGCLVAVESLAALIDAEYAREQSSPDSTAAAIADVRPVTSPEALRALDIAEALAAGEPIPPKPIDGAPLSREADVKADFKGSVMLTAEQVRQIREALDLGCDCADDLCAPTIRTDMLAALALLPEPKP
jgi:hypothetical protein